MSKQSHLRKRLTPKYLRPFPAHKNPRLPLLLPDSSPHSGPSHAFSPPRFLCAFALLCAFASNTTDAAPPQLPNILLLVADDQRPDTIAALGNPHIQTPNIDELVRRGTVFTRATCAHPLCYPSRAELLTGCTGFRNGTFSELKLNPGIPLLPQTLKKAGYRTCYVGKWHTAGRPSRLGYTECDGLYGSGRPVAENYVDFRGRPATGYGGWQFQTDDGQRFPEKGLGLTPNISSDFADAAIRLIQKSVVGTLRVPSPGGRGSPDPAPSATEGLQTSRQPFFIHVNFTAPHDPRIWPPGYEKKYDAAKLPLPANFLPEHPFDHGNIRGRDELLLSFPRTEDDVRQELACYYAVISHMDDQIGRIFQALDETGQRDNTIIIYTADHGLAIGSHGLVGKQNMYEHTINVPLILAGPGIPANQKRTAQCYLRDLFPTLCDLAGMKREGEARLREGEAPAEPIDGKSLAPVLRSFNPEPSAAAAANSTPPTEIHPFLIGYFQDSQRMIRESNWKLIWYPKINRWQLFDLAADSSELHDLVSEPAQAGRISELRAKLTRWLKEHNDPLAGLTAF